MGTSTSAGRAPENGTTTRPNDGRDCREEFARRFHRWLFVWVTWPVWGFAFALGVGLLGNLLSGRTDELPNSWAIGALFTCFVLTVFVRWNTRCPACGVRFRLTDYRPKHCQCGALLNDRHRNGPWW